MEVWEKINYLLEEKKITKQEFAHKLVALEPNLKRTGESPSAQTILGYLYGKRELKVELIPYIAEVLEVNEQDLFTFDLEYACNYNYRQSKEVRAIIELLQYAPNGVITHINEQLLKYKVLYGESVERI
ncbi:MAG: helix-turn-helix transcriptional regulator [Sulfuricurvum sp.]|nr:helix-turn-helix transcriptional regulator [Sulfuricurvum sp.]MDD5385848.1 helix-turn-helix transcriptional regulator [Sulfuricurvum sp.]